MEAVIPLTEKLWVYGPLGIFTVVAVVVAVQLFMRLTKERERFDNLMLNLSKQHKDELQALEERYITKAETWMAKYHEMALSQDLTIKSLQQIVSDFQHKMSRR